MPGGVGPDAGQADLGGGGQGKLLSPARRRRCIDRVRRACRVLGQHSSTPRQAPRGRADEARLVADMVELVQQRLRCHHLPGVYRKDAQISYSLAVSASARPSSVTRLHP